MAGSERSGGGLDFVIEAIDVHAGGSDPTGEEKVSGLKVPDGSVSVSGG